MLFDNLKKSKILIIAAHPDDEMIGCGASILKYNNKNINIIYTTRSYSKRIGIKNANDKFRKRNALNLLNELQIKTQFLKYPSLSLSRKYITELANDLYDLIIKNKPEIIFTHSYKDEHHDHRKTYEATMIACRPRKELFFLKKILTFEITPISNFGHDSFKPNFFINVKDYYKKKLQLLEKYYSDELHAYPHFRSLKAIENNMKYRGNSIGAEYAEGFELVFSIN